MKEEEIKKIELRPIEKLFLLSKERDDIYHKRDKVYCLLYFLIGNKNILIKNNSISKISFKGETYNTEYELKVLDFLDKKKYLELDSMVEKELIFNQTLVDSGILTPQVKAKKVLFWSSAKTELVKTALYHDLLAYLTREVEDKNNVRDAICGDEHKGDTRVLYLILKNKMLESQREEIEKKNKEKEKKRLEEEKKRKKEGKKKEESMEDMILGGL